MLSPDTIQQGHTLLLQLPSGERRAIKVEKSGQVSLGKFGNFRPLLLVGHPFGLTYEIVAADELRVVPPKRLEDYGDVDANNENIVDDVAAQTLSQTDIEKLKASGISAEEIITTQIAQHTSFGLKTAFSKDKYRARKAAKFSKQFTVLEPTIFAVCDHLFNKDHEKMRDLRPDSLSEMLVIANVRPNARILVVDDVSGLLVAAVLERTGGMGKVLSINDVESVPSYSALPFFNYDPVIVANTHATLNWAMTDLDFEPFNPLQSSSSALANGSAASASATSTAAQAAAADSVSETAASPQHFDRHRSRRTKQETAIKAAEEVRRDFFAGDWDALVMSSIHDPLSILRHLYPYLRPSAPIVVHAPYPQPLIKAQAEMRTDTSWLGAQIHQPWMRRHQALPGRTHPMMNMSGGGGFLLSATKVLDNSSATSVLAFRKGRNPFAVKEDLGEMVIATEDMGNEAEDAQGDEMQVDQHSGTLG
ncbi:Gcd10p-domain-containing protein [Auriculariales sp. MPI-PUGE-AT-0066]|nr:Gcd10p-domain-containing protein [Auriculariales sp. MPI-PUGE-AT-0066]